MGLDFSKTASAARTPQTSAVPATAAPAAEPVIEEVKAYDIVADREQMNATLVNSAEVDALKYY